MQKKNFNKELSPEKYIKTRARNLGIKACYISDNWKSAGIATLIVARQHKNSNVTHALYQVDMLAEGIVNTFFEFNLAGDTYNKVIEHYKKEQNLIECSYDMAHQIIYGAKEFAEKWKLKAHKDFELTRFVLETKDYSPKENVEIEFGENSKPLVIISAADNKENLIKKLDRNIGKDNYGILNLNDLADDNHDHDHHSHNHDEEAFDIPELAKPIDDKENIENWTEQDWQDFEEGKMEISAKTTLQVIDFMYDSHFEEEEYNALINKENLSLTKLNISKEAIAENNFFDNKQDEDRVKLIFLEVLDKASAKHIEVLEGELALNNNNPQLYSYLSNASIKLGNIGEAEKWTEKGYKKFPDYLFGQISYAQTLMQRGESDKVPEVFKNKYDLVSLLPKRKEFHILEVVNFYAIMCLYFTTQKDITSANIYWKILKELNEREEELVLLAENELMVEKAMILKQA